MLVHQRVYPKIASLVGKSIGNHWNFGCTTKHFQTHGYPKKDEQQKTPPPKFAGKNHLWRFWSRMEAGYLIGNWPIWSKVVDHFGLSSLIFHCQEVVAPGHFAHFDDLNFPQP